MQELFGQEKYLKNQELPNYWIIKPITNCILYLGDELAIRAVACRGTLSISMSRTLMEIVLTVPPYSQQPELLGAFHRLLESTPEKAALDIIENNFAPLNAHSLVSIWNAFDTAIEDLVVGLFINDESSYEKLSNNGYRIKHQVFSEKDPEQLKIAYKNIRRELSRTLNIYEIFNDILGVFGLAPEVNEITKNNLVDAHAIRNIIVHRGGEVDEIAARKSPYLRNYANKKIIIDEQKFIELWDAVGKYIQGILPRINKTDYFISK